MGDTARDRMLYKINTGYASELQFQCTSISNTRKSQFIHILPILCTNNSGWRNWEPLIEDDVRVILPLDPL
jgi:hypothetical protein